MGKKLKPRATAKADGQFTAAISDSAGRIWLAGLGAFAKAQVEGTKAFDSLIKEGEKVQDRAKKAALKAQAEGAKFFDELVREGEKVQRRAGKAASSSIADAQAKASGTWGKLEHIFEEDRRASCRERV